MTTRLPFSLSCFVTENQLRKLFETALEEDGARSDITSQYTLDKTARAEGRIRAKSDLILCGIEAVPQFFGWFDESTEVDVLMNDGTRLAPGDTAAVVRGSIHTLLAVERTALNLLQHLSGIATLTSKYVEAVSGTKAKILDTRKTLPGYRDLAKYAVRCGGGFNHRMGLNDAVLIKDNHIAGAGGVGKSVLMARKGGGADTFIEVEVVDMAGLEEAMDAGADRVMLDNMPAEEMARCVARAQGRVELEASGNVNLETVASIAATGVNYISVGALTHSAPAADLNMKIVPIQT